MRVRRELAEEGEEEGVMIEGRVKMGKVKWRR